MRKQPIKVVPQQPAVPFVPPQEDDYLTPHQLADKLHVKVSTVWEWTRRRQHNPIPHYTISRKAVYYRWSEVNAWIEKHRGVAA